MRGVGTRNEFMMTGAAPNTDWLGNCVVLDSNGYVKTGPQLTVDDLRDASWPLARPPFLLETSLPGVFAVGDARGGSIKRVAAAVGKARPQFRSCIRSWRNKEETLGLQSLTAVV